MSRVPPLRVGSVPYIVGRPLDLGLEAEPDLDFSYDVPARLVERLRSDELDVALVSSIELFRRPGYRYLTDIAVTGRGFVASVQVFLRHPLDRVRTIALDPASRTAAALTRALLPDRTFVEVAPDEDAREAPADGWLRIGDPALREYLAPDAPPVFNPSEHWTNRTGLPFVFATWIVRPGVDIAPHVPTFARARARGAEGLEELCVQAAEQWDLPLDACRNYLGSECVYDAGEDMHAALIAFRDAAARVDGCRADLAPEAVHGAAREVG